MNNLQLPVRFEITIYRGDGHEAEVRTITAEERRSLDHTAFDYVLDNAGGILGFRTESGEWLERPISGSGLGRKSLDIIRAIQLNPGVFLGCVDIAELTGNEYYLDNNALAVRVATIRRTHSENKSPRLFVTRRQGGYALMWPAKFSWIWIDRIVARTVGSDGQAKR